MGPGTCPEENFHWSPAPVAARALRRRGAEEEEEAKEEAVEEAEVEEEEQQEEDPRRADVYSTIAASLCKRADVDTLAYFILRPDTIIYVNLFILKVLLV